MPRCVADVCQQAPFAHALCIELFTAVVYILVTSLKQPLPRDFWHDSVYCNYNAFPSMHAHTHTRTHAHSHAFALFYAHVLCE